MSISIMQPYFFPNIGYFALINYSDRFIFFDTPQYISHGWVNRNRILKADGETTYITVPIKKAPRDTSIQEIRIVDDTTWISKIYGQLSVYKKKAPFYTDVYDLVSSILERHYTKISELNIDSTIEVCNYLGIESSFEVFSKMNLDIGTVRAPDEWALKIALALSENEYINPPGGKNFFDVSKYVNNGIELKFLKSNLPRYIQRTGTFEPGLSIIDVMMFCEKEHIKEMLEDFEIMDK